MNSDLWISFVCEAKPKKSIEGKHRTPAWLGRVPKEDVPAILRFLKAQGTKARVIYRDKSGQNRYNRGRYWKSGQSAKNVATHADIYEQPPGEFSSRHYAGGYQLMSDAARLRKIKAALNGKKTDDPQVLKMLAEKPVWALTYAKNSIKGRWIEGEELIAKSDLAKNYLELFPEAKWDWAINGWLDWTDI
jgi:hypothetical protein